MVIFWPEVAWCEDAGPELRIAEEEFGWVADVAHNPSRESAWTGLFYDHVAGVWMVSCETPIDIEGRHVATVGHDITLDELLHRTVNDHLSGTYNVLFRPDGRLIAHPDLMDAIKAQDGYFDIAQSGDEKLKRIHELTARARIEGVVEAPDEEEYLAATHMREPDWYFVTVYPRSALLTEEFSRRDAEHSARARRAEDLLASTEAQLRAALDYMPGGIKAVDKDLNYVLLNAQYSELYEFPDDLLEVGDSMRTELRYQAERGDMGPGNKEDLVEGVVARYQKTTAQGKPISFERKISSGRTLQINVAPTPQGGAVTIVADITDRKKAEKALSDQLKFTEALIDTIPNPIFVKDHEARYAIFNRAWEQAFGESREEHLGKTVMEMERLPLEKREQLMQEDMNLLRAGGTRHTETTRTYADGQTHDVLYWQTVFQLTDGVVGGLVGVLVDISEQKRAEEALARAKDAA
ncbi:MAG: PAS-domain containing protein, partial [Gammaproteobacteria bacterium]|nr:PAS-domain containing protein [Gammaproteobacteria bacterium]